ncbi:MAG TPA: methionyl-tRNA formyltransferase, partial [Pirellulaceae bacterium]|nr:methionyl-tRNA formyltransferase [Pirellulaceae bacterium]
SLDGGPIIASSPLAIDQRETAGELEARLAQLGPDVVLKAIEQLATWDGKSPCGTVQDTQLASSARRLRKGDGLILWKRSAQDLANQVRAFQPWPGSFTFYHPPHRPPLRLILLEVEVVAAPPGPRDDDCLAPGEFAFVDNHSLWVQTGDGWLAIRRLQPAGKGPMSIGEFLRGHRLTKGESFACETVPNIGPHG